MKQIEIITLQAQLKATQDILDRKTLEAEALEVKLHRTQRELFRTEEKLELLEQRSGNAKEAI